MSAPVRRADKRRDSTGGIEPPLNARDVLFLDGPRGDLLKEGVPHGPVTGSNEYPARTLVEAMNETGIFWGPSSSSEGRCMREEEIRNGLAALAAGEANGVHPGWLVDGKDGAVSVEISKLSHGVTVRVSAKLANSRSMFCTPFVAESAALVYLSRNERRLV